MSSLSHIPSLISNNENEVLGEIPGQEVKNVVLHLKGDSASRPGGLLGNFYQV